MTTFSLRVTTLFAGPLVLAAVFLGQIKPLTAAELEEFAFEPNPGELLAFIHIPQDLPENPALVVALHGCLQQASAYDDETGWRELADEINFVLLLPQQQVSNNPLQCFSWMEDDDRVRDGGEAESIRHMVEAAMTQYHIDRSRIFITGLSAGGAMTSVMLATHPDIFAGGAIIGGLPYLCATYSIFASFCLSSGNFWVTAGGWAERVIDAVDFEVKQWPRVSIWNGDSDAVVDPVNAEDLMQQWTGVHDIDREPEIDEEVGPTGTGFMKTIRAIRGSSGGLPPIPDTVCRSIRSTAAVSIWSLISTIFSR